MKRTFLFATIASILSINAYAVSATVTSKDYVDTTRQATIPASGTNSATPGDTVVTYTDTAGTIGERGIFNPDTDYDWDNYEVVEGHEGDLVTAGIYEDLAGVDQAVSGGTEGSVPVYNWLGRLGTAERGIYDGSNGYNSSTDADKLVTASALQNVSYEINNMPTKTVTYKTCTQWSGTPHTDANCLLWNLSDTNVVGYQCSTSADCPEPNYCTCINHTCNCNFN